MRSFLRKNPTIAFGLGLPLLLVVSFLLISGIPTLLVAPPQYDVLYATEYYNYQNSGLQISVVGQKVQVTYQGNALNNRKPRLWRYNPKTGGVKEIAIVLPPNLLSTKKKTPPENVSKITPINLPDLERLTIDSSSIAPDGYEFSVGKNRYSSSPFGGLFYSSRYRHEAILIKDGRSIRLPNASEQYYNDNTHFLGWIISP